MARKFGNVISTVLIALLTSLVTGNYYVNSRVIDRGASLVGAAPVSTKVFFDRDNGVQGLTWALHGSLEPLSINEGLLLERAAGSELNLMSGCVAEEVSM